MNWYEKEKPIYAAKFLYWEKNTKIFYLYAYEHYLLSSFKNLWGYH